MNTEKEKKREIGLKKLEYLYYPVVFTLSLLVAEFLKNIWI